MITIQDNVPNQEKNERKGATITLRKQDFDDGNEQSPPPTSELLQRVLQIRAQIIEESGGYLFEDSAEAVRRMREERTQYLEQLREQKWETK